MAGIDRYTGKVITGWSHVLQSLGVIFTTRIGSRFMRRTFGSAVPALLGRSMTPGLLLRYKAAIIIATELFEPRFKVSIVYSDADENTPESLRTGAISMTAMGEYRPRGHLGDDTPDTLTRSVVIGTTPGGVLEIR